MVKGKAFQKAWKSQIEVKKATLKSRKPAKRHVNKVTQAKKTFQVKLEDRKKLKAVQDREKAINDKNKDKRKAAAKKREAKKKRKEKNSILAGQYQIIKKTDKIRRWNKKAKKTLMRMDPDIYAKLLQKSRI